MFDFRREFRFQLKLCIAAKYMMIFQYQSTVPIIVQSP